MAPDPQPERPSAVTEAPLSYGLFMLSRALHAYGAELLSRLDLHPGQELLLMQLFDADGQTQAELQRAVGLDHSTVSRSIRRMQDAGLVVRDRSGRDRRAMVVHLTAEGAALRLPLQRLWATLERAAGAGLGTADAADLTRVAAAVEQSLREHRQAGRREEAGGPQPRSST